TIALIHGDRAPQQDKHAGARLACREQRVAASILTQGSEAMDARDLSGRKDREHLVAPAQKLARCVVGHVVSEEQQFEAHGTRASERKRAYPDRGRFISERLAIPATAALRRNEPQSRIP